jgi:PPE-repeat protein
LTRTFLAILSALADTFRSKLLESTGQQNLNTARAGTGSVEYLRSTLDQTAAAEAEAALATVLGDAEADEVTVDGDVAGAHTEFMSLMGLMFQIQIAASPRKSGRH